MREIPEGGGEWIEFHAKACPAQLRSPIPIIFDFLERFMAAPNGKRFSTLYYQDSCVIIECYPAGKTEISSFLVLSCLGVPREDPWWDSKTTWDLENWMVSPKWKNIFNSVLPRQSRHIMMLANADCYHVPDISVGFDSFGGNSIVEQQGNCLER